MGTVLSGYLSLRKLVVQRTKLIDDTQDKFLELLEDMTSGGAQGDSVILLGLPRSYILSFSLPFYNTHYKECLLLLLDLFQVFHHSQVLLLILYL